MNGTNRSFVVRWANSMQQGKAKEKEKGRKRSEHEAHWDERLAKFEALRAEEAALSEKRISELAALTARFAQTVIDREQIAAEEEATRRVRAAAADAAAEAVLQKRGGELDIAERRLAEDQRAFEATRRAEEQRVEEANLARESDRIAAEASLQRAEAALAEERRRFDDHRQTKEAEWANAEASLREAEAALAEERRLFNESRHAKESEWTAAELAREESLQRAEAALAEERRQFDEMRKAREEEWAAAEAAREAILQQAEASLAEERHQLEEAQRAAALREAEAAREAAEDERTAGAINVHGAPLKSMLKYMGKVAVNAKEKVGAAKNAVQKGGVKFVTHLNGMGAAAGAASRGVEPLSDESPSMPPV